jgi:hypothetical protein
VILLALRLVRSEPVPEKEPPVIRPVVEIEPEEIKDPVPKFMESPTLLVVRVEVVLFLEK